MKNKVLAQVNGKEIFEKDVEALLNSVEPQRVAQFNSPEGRENLLKELINQELFYFEALESNIQESEQYINEVEKVKTQILKNMYITNFMNSLEVDEEELKNVYESDKSKFQSTDEVKAAHILVKEKDAAQKAISDLENGSDFGDLAKELSICPSKDNGGDLGFFSKGNMVPEFETAAFSLNVGDISDIVETQFGYHIIKVLEKKEAAEKSFDEIKGQLKQELTNKKQEESYFKKIEDLKQKYKIEIM